MPPLAAAVPILQSVGGLAQTIFGGIRAKKAQRELENLQTPVYEKSKSIDNYYNQALQRYNVDPYSSSLYKMQSQNIQRGANQGLSALQDRRSGLAGISSLMQGQNDALLKAGVSAEDEKNRRFGQLGTATNMQAGEERQAFNVNKMMPYEKRYNLLAQKAAGGANTMNAGLQNVFGGLSGLGQFGMMQEFGSTGQQGDNNQDRYLSYSMPRRASYR